VSDSLPTREDTARALDAQVAEEVMGWQRFPYLMEPAPGTVRYCPPGRVHVSTIEKVPPYSTDYTAVRLVEDEIERRGLGPRFVAELGACVCLEYPYANRGVWRILRASPEDRCRAALSAVRSMVAK